MEVVVGGGGGAAARGKLGGGGLLALEAGEDDVGAVDDGGGEAGEAGDVDAVALVGGAGDDAAEEDDGVALFADLDGVVFDAGEGGGEVGELVVVGGEEGAGFALGGVVEVFDDGPGDGDAVEGGGAAADFVKDDEGAGGGVVEDVGGFLHLDHEGGAAAGEVVAGANAGEDAVNEADLHLFGGDGAADVGHDGEDGDLADVGGFTGHVGAGDEDELAGGAVEECVVWDEAFGAGLELNDGVAALADDEVEGVVDDGATVGEGEGAVGEALEDVELGDGGGGGLDGGELGDGLGAEGLEELVFEGVAFVLGAVDAAFVFLELGGDVALGVDDGLAALVGGGDEGELGFADLDVETEDVVVADAEGANAGGFLLLGLVAGNPGVAVLGGLAVGIEVGVVAFADDAAFADGEGRVVDEGAGQLGGEVGEVAELGGEVGEALGLGAGEAFAELGDLCEGVGEGAEVAGVAGAAGETGHHALQVAGFGEDGAEVGEAAAVALEVFDGVLAGVDGGQGVEGRADPGAEEALAHGGAGAVEHAEKGLGLGAAAGDGQEVEVAAGALVQREEVAGVADIEGSDVGEVAAELVADVVEECAGGADPLREGALAAVTLQRMDVELVGERVGGLVGHEAPGVGGGEGAGDRGGEGGGELVALVVGHHGFAGGDAAEGLDEGGLAVGVLHGQGAGGELERGNAIGTLAGEDSGDVVRGFGIEEGVFGERAGGDDAGDLAADEALGGLGVFGLLADGGFEAGADDLGQIVRLVTATPRMGAARCASSKNIS